MVTSYGYYEINMQTLLLFEIYIHDYGTHCSLLKKSHFYIAEPDSLRQ